MHGNDDRRLEPISSYTNMQQQQQQRTLPTLGQRYITRKVLIPPPLCEPFYSSLHRNLSPPDRVSRQVTHESRPTAAAATFSFPSSDELHGTLCVVKKKATLFKMVYFRFCPYFYVTFTHTRALQKNQQCKYTRCTDH